MPSRIPASLRRAVIQRAKHRCEYCHKPSISFFVHEVDHIIAQKHGGETSLTNLAYACFECNRYKGSDIASIDSKTNTTVLLFNPRTQQWSDHFRLNNGKLIPLTPEGRVTVFLLRLNEEERIMERVTLNYD